MNTPIQFFRREVYGNVLFYIKDPAISCQVAILTGKKTLLPDHKQALESLGLTFEEVLAPY